MKIEIVSIEIISFEDFVQVSGNTFINEHTGQTAIFMNNGESALVFTPEG